LESVVLRFLSGLKVHKEFFLITGLGRVYTRKRFFGLEQFIYERTLKFASYRYSAKFIFQNNHDPNILGVSTYGLINGSGVPVLSNCFSSIDFASIKVVTATRLIKEKGIDDIIKFCRYIISNDLNIHYTVLGSLDKLNGFYRKTIEELVIDKRIRFEGFKNFAQDEEKYHFAFYPTYYKEGAPRFLIESLSKGLILLTYDQPGCREMIQNGNGFLLNSYKNIPDVILETEFTNLLEMSKKSLDLFDMKYKYSAVYTDFNKIINAYTV
jgi:glycosyltransferase involved in cell wall biosynthesis